MQKSIGNELKIIRIRNNLKLEDVSDSLNINRETLRRYENNANLNFQNGTTNWDNVRLY